MRLVETPGSGLTRFDQARLRGLLSNVAEWCATLSSERDRASLQHDDLHDGNVFVGPAGAGGVGGGDRIFDWGDAAVGHPSGLLATLRSIASRDASLGAPTCSACATPTSSRGPADNRVPRSTNRPDRPARRGHWTGLRLGTRAERSPPAILGEDAGASEEWLLELFEPTVI